MNANEIVKTPESGNVTPLSELGNVPPTNPESVPTPPESGTNPDPAPVADRNPVSAADNAPADANPEPDYKTLYENARRERDILLRNAELARQAPVRGVSGGAVALPADDFTRGFDSDTW